MAETGIPALVGEEIRQQFPIFQRVFHGAELVYLDSAATAQKPQLVVQALVDFYFGHNANIHRGAYALSEEATAAYEDARQKAAAFVHAHGPEEIVFVRNATEGINLVASSWGRANVQRGDHIVVSELEHHSNLVPWQLLAEEREAILDFVPIDDRGHLDLEVFDRFLALEPKLVAVGQVSNALGTINPLAKMARQAHRAGAVVLADGAQSVPHSSVDVQTLGVDFLVWSGHKMCGPTGIGVLYGRRELLEKMPPFLGGGDMIRRVEREHSTWNDLPWKFEAGTPHIAGAIGLGAAIDFIEQVGRERIVVQERSLLRRLLEEFRELPYVTCYGPLDVEHQAGILSFNLGRLHPHDVATLLDRRGIAVRSGHHCCQPLMQRLGVAATVRASFYLYNTERDVAALVAGVREIARQFHLGEVVSRGQ